MFYSLEKHETWELENRTLLKNNFHQTAHWELPIGIQDCVSFKDCTKCSNVSRSVVEDRFWNHLDVPAQIRNVLS